MVIGHNLVIVFNIYNYTEKPAQTNIFFFLKTLSSIMYTLVSFFSIMYTLEVDLMNN